ncbi:ISAs1 family transposase [Actinomadura sp. 6K520]|uniref:ISAs1 family transposase n=1 Tax=Actinomadura sp. 6K520 TaxID=2530364 RepID=UPI0010508A06|nr:ISAs1 family transposase [Actinomadura sp. 6K520]TDE20443.1 ISAs1 family transposase [Actinomadura sp. 6K520]
MAVDGKTVRGTRRPDGTRPHLVAAVHAGVVLAQRQTTAKRGETACFTGLLEPLDLHGTVVTADALHTVRDHAAWLVDTKSAHYIVIVKSKIPAPSPAAQAPPVARVQMGDRTRDRAHGRDETRRLKVCTVNDLLFPHAAQAGLVNGAACDHYRDRPDHALQLLGPAM